MPAAMLSGAFARGSILSTNTDEAHRRAEALFKKEQQLRESQQAMAEYQAELRAMREKTARLRALRLARDAARLKGGGPAKRRGAA
jgi:type IV secretory pathway VirB4 component